MTRYLGNEKRNIRWLGYVERMPEERTVKMIMERKKEMVR
jgi:hypothetical protein